MRLISCLVIVVAMAWADPALAARCTGSSSCRACKTCSSCAHCKAGGSCGVCRPSRPPAPPAVPTTPTPRTVDPQTAPPRPSHPQALSETGSIIPYFSPGGGVTDAIVAQINAATQSVKVQAYRLTSPQIAKALAAAHERKVKVEIILDKRQQSDKYSDATYFANHGIAVTIDHEHAIAHDKVMIIDDRVVITGSFNFSQAGETANAENMLVISGFPEVTKAYLGNWQAHHTHSQRYKGFVAQEDGDEHAEDEQTDAGSSCCVEMAGT